MIGNYMVLWMFMITNPGGPRFLPCQLCQLCQKRHRVPKTWKKTFSGRRWLLGFLAKKLGAIFTAHWRWNICWILLWTLIDRGDVSDCQSKMFDQLRYITNVLVASLKLRLGDIWDWQPQTWITADLTPVTRSCKEGTIQDVFQIEFCNQYQERPKSWNNVLKYTQHRYNVNSWQFFTRGMVKTPLYYTYVKESSLVSGKCAKRLCSHRPPPQKRYPFFHFDEGSTRFIPHDGSVSCMPY